MPQTPLRAGEMGNEPGGQPTQGLVDASEQKCLRIITPNRKQQCGVEATRQPIPQPNPQAICERHFLEESGTSSQPVRFELLQPTKKAYLSNDEGYGTDARACLFCARV